MRSIYVLFNFNDYRRSVETCIRYNRYLYRRGFDLKTAKEQKILYQGLTNSLWAEQWGQRVCMLADICPLMMCYFETIRCLLYVLCKCIRLHLVNSQPKLKTRRNIWITFCINTLYGLLKYRCFVKSVS